MKPEIEAARQVRRGLEIVCARLEHPTPESLDTAAGELSVAIRLLRGLERRLGSTGTEPQLAPALANEMLTIRRELSRAQAMLMGAGRFLQGWARLVGAEADGAEEVVLNYTPRCVTGPVLAAAGGKLVLHG